jgi:hypothetical protein
VATSSYEATVSLATARTLLQSRLDNVARGTIPSPPASRLLQRSGFEAAVEARLCGETLALLLESRSAPLQSLLVIDLSTTGRAATVWLGNMMTMLAPDHPALRITFTLPGTRRAGRGFLLERYLEGISKDTGLEVSLISGPASIERSAPEGAEALQLRDAFDLIVVLSLAGSAGLEAPWPTLPERGWLALADAAVLTFIDPDSLVGDLDRISLLDSGPPRLRVETLDSATPKLVGRVDVEALDEARRELPLLIETARRRPWRAVAEPKPGTHGTELGCPSETAAITLIEPAKPRRTLTAGRLRLIATEARDGER